MSNRLPIGKRMAAGIWFNHLGRPIIDLRIANLPHGSRQAQATCGGLQPENRAKSGSLWYVDNTKFNRILRLARYSEKAS